MRSITGLFFLFLATLISAGEPKLKKGDRQIIGDQLDYGRKAAEFGLWNEAIFHWEKVIAKDPNNASATNNLAVAYESVGAYEKAEAMYRTAIDLNEDNAEIRKNMKRFSSFYRKHKKQLEREQKVKIKSKSQKATPPPTPKPEQPATSSEGGPR